MIRCPQFHCPDCGLPFELLKEYLQHLSYLADGEKNGRAGDKPGTAIGQP